MTPSKKSLTNEELEAARQKWIAERPQFEAFADYLKRRLQESISAAGIHAEVTSRAKEVHSLVKKLITKPNHTYDTLPDKAGVRVCVKFRSEVAPVVEIANKLFTCTVDPRGGTGNVVGYISTHLDTELKVNDPEVKTFPLGKFRAEVQVRTMAQHLWSEMAHEIYKGEVHLPSTIERRVHLMAGLLEVADNEFDWIHEETLKQPNEVAYRILNALERQYLKLTSIRGNPELSLQIIDALAPLYAPPPADWNAYFEALFSQKETVLKTLFKNEDPNVSTFLFQPEALMIYDRLRKDRYKLKTVWSDDLQFPLEQLQKFAETFGDWE